MKKMALLLCLLMSALAFADNETIDLKKSANSARTSSIPQLNASTKPMKHGYVKRVADWQYSSFQRYVAKGILPMDWAGNGVEIEDGFGE